MIIRRYLLCASIVVLSLVALSSCRSDKKVGLRPCVAVSIDPQRYFVSAVADTLFDVHSVVPVGVSPETYDPTPRDMVALADCVGYLYVGGLGFEVASVDRIASANPSLRLFDLSKGLESDICSADSLHGKHNHHHDCDGDPHYWVSCVGAKAMTIATAEALSQLSPQDSVAFVGGRDRMLRRIDSTYRVLDARLDAAGRPAFVIYHPSLSYYADEFGLKQLVIEQQGKEPSPAHLVRLIEQARRLKVRTVFVQREFSRMGAEQIAQALGARLVEIAPLSGDWQSEIRRITDELCRH